MELLLDLLAVVVGAVALAAALQVRAALGQSQADLQHTRAQLEGMQAEIDRLRSETGDLRKRLDEAPPAPPLPRARHGGLDDLREQLRAAHRESAEAEADAEL